MTIVATACLWNDIDSYLVDILTTDLGQASALYTTLLIAPNEIIVADKLEDPHLIMPSILVATWTMDMQPGDNRGDGKAHTDNTYHIGLGVLCKDVDYPTAKADLSTLMQRVLVCLQSRPTFAHLASALGETVQDVAYGGMDLQVRGPVQGQYIGAGSLELTVRSSGV